MAGIDRFDANRRSLLALGAGAAAVLALGLGARGSRAAGPLKIGVIGSGKLGGTVGSLWVKAGHPVMFSARNLDEVKSLAAGLGPLASAGTPVEAAAFGEVVLVAVPYGALAQVGKDCAAGLKGKVVLDACNAIAARDGEQYAAAAKEKGIGALSAEYLPGTRLVRAFNCVGYTKLRSETHRAPPLVAIPLASDDAEALKVAAALVTDAGFEPLVVGPLARAKDFAAGTPVFGQALTAAELRQKLAL